MLVHPCYSIIRTIIAPITTNINCIYFLVKKAYYRCSLSCHPDNSANKKIQSIKYQMTKKFQALGKVYAVLSDRSRRTLYNREGNQFSSIIWMAQYYMCMLLVHLMKFATSLQLQDIIACKCACALMFSICIVLLLSDSLPYLVL